MTKDNQDNQDVYLKLIPGEEACAEALRASLEKEALRAEKNTKEYQKFISINGYSRGHGNRTVWWGQTEGVRNLNPSPTSDIPTFPLKLDYESNCLISSVKMNMFDLLQYCVTPEQIESIRHLESELKEIEISSNGTDYDDRPGETTEYEFDVVRIRTPKKTPYRYYNDLLAYGRSHQEQINKLVLWNEQMEKNLVILYTAVDRADRAEFEKLSEKYGKKDEK